MDNIDLKILRCLTDNARMSASDIGAEVRLSTSAVIERIKKLEQNGTVKGYTALLDPVKLGKDVTAIMSIVVDHPKYNDGFISAVSANPHITECLYIAGEVDFFIKVVTDNTKTLETVLNQLKSIPGVSKTKTNIVLNAPKLSNPQI